MSNSVFRTSLVAVIAVLYLAVFFYLDRWPTTLYYGDSSHYYLHVVSFFIHRDVGDYDKTISSLIETNPTSKDPRDDEFGIRLTEKGKRYIKYTVGVPLFETPFFLLAHTYASISHKYRANGWSRPYMLIVGLAPIFYICLGFWLLTGVFLEYFSRYITALVIMAIAFATNLLYQGTYVVMAHAYLFFAHALLIWLTVRFYRSPTRRGALFIGMTVGLIALTRVPEIISAVVPLIWGVGSTSSLRNRLRLFKTSPSILLTAALGTVLVFSVQLAYWHYVSGKLFFDPYAGEGIDLANPKLHKGWFNFANGWLVYTPVMIFSLVGLALMRGKSKDAFWPILLFVLPHAYIHYSYYAWTYFPGLGQRPMVETYPLLGFGLAAFFAYCRKSRWSGWIPAFLIAGFSVLNIFQTWQSDEGIIWSERGNKPFYFATFGKTSPSKESFRAYDTNAAQPDTGRIEFVTALFYEDFESLEGEERSETRAYSGNASLLSASSTSNWQVEIPLDQVRGKEWLKISLMAFLDAEEEVANRDHSTQFVVQLHDENGKRRRYRSLTPATHIGNDVGSIWTTGKSGMWGKAMFYFQMPARIDGWILKLYVLNTHGQDIYIDDVRIERYRRR